MPILTQSGEIPVKTEADFSAAVAWITSNGGGVIRVMAPFSLTALYSMPTGSVLRGDRAGSLITCASGGTILLSNGVKMEDLWMATSLTASSVSATTTSGSSTVTVTTTGLYAGMVVEGTGIRDGVYLTAVGASTVTLSKPATVTGTNTLTFTPALVLMPNNYSEMSDCRLSVPAASTCVGVHVSGNLNRMYDNVFTGVSGGSTGVGIYYGTGSGNTDTNSVFLP